MSASASPPASLKELHRTFITACHVLHYHGILDAYGHLSVRHPTRPDVFIMSQYIAPGTISSPRDLIEYWVSDASPVDPNAAPGYSERCIHSEVLKKFPKMNAVIHSHSSPVVPFTFSGVPLQPVYHMAGFLQEHTPIYDIADHYSQGDKQDLLVRNTKLGGALADCFADKQGEEISSVVLMRGHGFTCMAPSIEDCVMRAYYTQANAQIQSTALNLRAAHLSRPSVQASDVPDLKYLSAAEREGAKDMTLTTCMRPWNLWCREVEAHPLIVHEDPKLRGGCRKETCEKAFFA